MFANAIAVCSMLSSKAKERIKKLRSSGNVGAASDLEAKTKTIQACWNISETMLEGRTHISVAQDVNVILAGGHDITYDRKLAITSNFCVMTSINLQDIPTCLDIG